MKTRAEDLLLLLAVVDSGGFSAAADMLNIQVAKVSRAVARIESELNVTLLNRTTRRIELTEEGQRFVDSIRPGLQVLLAAEEDIIQQAERPSGRLRIDAASPFMLHQVVPLIPEFRQCYPLIDLELTSNEGYVDLLEQRTDVAIRIGPLNDSSLHARSLGRSELFIVAAPSYLKKRGFPQDASELTHHERIGFVAPTNLNRWPIPAPNIIEPTIASLNGEVVRHLAITGCGIACLSGFMVKEDLAHGRLVQLLNQYDVNNTGRENIHAVYYRSSAVAKRISLFLDFLQPRLTL